MAAPTSTKMTPDPQPDWKEWLGGGIFAGGFVGALLSKWHSCVTRSGGPSDAEFDAIMSRISQLEVDRDEMHRTNKRALGEITYELREIRARLD